MASMNVCTFTGNLTRDAEVRSVGDSEVAAFAIAVNGRKDEVMYMDCDYWKPGQVVEYLTRGKAVAVSGELKCRQYEKDGVKRTAYSLRVNNLTLLGSRERAEAETSPF